MAVVLEGEDEDAEAIDGNTQLDVVLGVLEDAADVEPDGGEVIDLEEDLIHGVEDTEVTSSEDAVEGEVDGEVLNQSSFIKAKPLHSPQPPAIEYNHRTLSYKLFVASCTESTEIHST